MYGLKKSFKLIENEGASVRKEMSVLTTKTERGVDHVAHILTSFIENLVEKSSCTQRTCGSTSMSVAELIRATLDTSGYVCSPVWSRQRLHQGVPFVHAKSLTSLRQSNWYAGVAGCVPKLTAVNSKSPLEAVAASMLMGVKRSDYWNWVNRNTQSCIHIDWTNKDTVGKLHGQVLIIRCES